MALAQDFHIDHEQLHEKLQADNDEWIYSDATQQSQDEPCELETNHVNLEDP